MSKIIIEYCPPFSEEANELIEKEITASAVSNDKSSSQYDIDMVREKLCDNDLLDDLLILDELIKEKVNYIEL